ncbi:MAG: CRISPR-associated endonuclease Cas2 [Bacteroidales bacterium]
MSKQFMVVSYDISDDRHRRKIMKTLEDFGTRVQYSVFECRLNPAEISRLKRQLQPHVRDTQDTVRFYFIGAEDVPRIQVIGAGKVTEDKVFFIQ